MSPGVTNASISLQHIWVRTARPLPPVLRADLAGVHVLCVWRDKARLACGSYHPCWSRMHNQNVMALLNSQPLLLPLIRTPPPFLTRAGRVLVFSHEPRGVSSHFPCAALEPKDGSCSGALCFAGMLCCSAVHGSHDKPSRLHQRIS